MEFNLYLLKFGIYTKNGGVVSDLVTHWNYILALRENLQNIILYTMGEDTKLINFPLHNIIFSQFYILTENIKNYLNFYFVFSMLMPFFFYLCLREKFKEINKLILLIFSSIIYLLPVFQYTAIWGNSHITSLFFFLIGILFHIKFRNSNYKDRKYFLFCIISLTLATYSKQFYAFFFLFIFLELLIKVKLKVFLLFSIFTIILSLPGLFFLYKNPLLFFGIKQTTTNFGSAILICSSICFIYILPFLIQYFINEKNDFVSKIKKLFVKKYFILTFIIFILCVPFFYYEGSIGGGIIFKLFYLKLEQKYLFLLSSFIGMYFLIYFTHNNLYSYFLTFLLLCTFSTGFYIFQKYFEPMFLIIFLIYFNKEKIIKSINKSNYVSVFYYSSYLLISNYIYFFGI